VLDVCHRIICHIIYFFKIYNIFKIFYFLKNRIVLFKKKKKINQPGASGSHL
jgi:hypothetical protein